MDTTRTVNFLYAYKDYAGKDCEAKLDIKLPFEDDSIDELVTQLLSQMDPMMRYLDEDVSKLRIYLCILNCALTFMEQLRPQ